MIFQRKKVKTQAARQEIGVVWTGGMVRVHSDITGIAGKYQRRTPTGVGRP
jgi:hypothetical protein